MDQINTSPDLRWRSGELRSGRDSAIELWNETPGGDIPDFTLSGAYLFLRRNLWRIALASLLAGGATFAGSLILFNKYSATATIMVDPRPANITQGAGVLPNIGADAIAIESLVQVCKSNSFLGALVDRLDLVHDSGFGERDDAIEKLAGQLNITRRGTTYVIDATATNHSAEKSAAIANAAAQAIIDGQRQLRSGVDDKTSGEINERLEEVSGRLSRAEKAAAKLKTTLQVTDVGQGSTLLERRVFELNQQHILANAKTEDARARFEQLRRAVGAGANLSPSIQSSVLNSLRVEYARLSRQSADQTTVLGALHPNVAALNAQIADIKRQISAEITRMVATARTDALEAEQKEASIASQLKDAQKESGDLGPQMVKLDELDREAKAERSIYEQLLTRQRELAGTRNLSPNDIHFVSPATPPAKIKPGITIRTAGATAVGLLVGLAFAFVREAMNGALTTPRQAERLRGVKVAGLAPSLTKTGQRPSLTPWLVDLCAGVASNINGKEARVVLITSTFRGAGCSTVAANCANYLGDGGARVLLIEADRSNSTSGPKTFGLIDALERGEDLRGAFKENAAAGYTLLPFGGRDFTSGVSTSALMSGVTMRAVMKLCREWFDILIIDGPPVMEGGEARLLARQSDLTVLVVEWNKTTASDVSETMENLQTENALLFFNRVDIARLRLLDPAQARRMKTHIR